MISNVICRMQFGLNSRHKDKRLDKIVTRVICSLRKIYECLDILTREKPLGYLLILFMTIYEI